METAQEKARRKTLNDNFNLTPEEWDKVDKFQINCCWICHKKQKSGKRLATDHSHTSGLFRDFCALPVIAAQARLLGFGVKAQKQSNIYFRQQSIIVIHRLCRLLVERSTDTPVAVALRSIERSFVRSGRRIKNEEKLVPILEHNLEETKWLHQ